MKDIREDLEKYLNSYDLQMVLKFRFDDQSDDEVLILHTSLHILGFMEVFAVHRKISFDWEYLPTFDKDDPMIYVWEIRRVS